MKAAQRKKIAQYAKKSPNMQKIAHFGHPGFMDLCADREELRGYISIQN
jgi:hypothetical protein